MKNIALYLRLLLAHPVLIVERDQIVSSAPDFPAVEFYAYARPEGCVTSYIRSPDDDDMEAMQAHASGVPTHRGERQIVLSQMSSPDRVAVTAPVVTVTGTIGRALRRRLPVTIYPSPTTLARTGHP